MIQAQIHASGKIGISTFVMPLHPRHHQHSQDQEINPDWDKISFKSTYLLVSLTTGFQLAQVPIAGMSDVVGPERAGHPGQL